MSDFKKRIKAKMKESGMSASQFLDGLIELFCDVDGLTDEEIREDLEAEGVDVDAALKRTQEMVQRHLERLRMEEKTTSIVALKKQDGGWIIDTKTVCEVETIAEVKAFFKNKGMKYRLAFDGNGDPDFFTPI